MEISWQKDFLNIASKIEKQFDEQKFALKDKLNLIHPVTIQVYRGFRGKENMHLQGRVLENEGLDLPPPNASVWQNIRSLYNRFESDEIPYAPVEIQLGNNSYHTKCNREGFFNFNFPSRNLPDSNNKWEEITLSLLKMYHKDQEVVKVKGELMLQQAQNSYGIISDVDDTIVVSHATEFLEKMRVFLLRNAHTRKPLQGVAALYQAMERGKEKNCQNPFFYVSSSSWNLYDVLVSFCQINKIPKGAFLLQELGLNKDHFFNKGHDHKLQKIKQVLDSFTHLPFVLIGDSGQKDPEIYEQIVNQYPGRIKAIFIRDVKPAKSEKSDIEVDKIANALGKKGVKMILIQDSVEAAMHAIEMGLIAEDELSEIKKETSEDENRPSDISSLLGLDQLL